jgi:hypothetical protein
MAVNFLIQSQCLNDEQLLYAYWVFIVYKYTNSYPNKFLLFGK